MRRILVTGFEVFSQHNSNISQDIVSTLDEKIIVDDPWYKSRTYKLDGVEIELERKILTVDSLAPGIFLRGLVKVSRGMQLFIWACVILV